MLRPIPSRVDFNHYQDADDDFAHLSFADFSRALCHALLMRHSKVVGTAIGRYRIRSEDSWLNDPKQHDDTGVPRLDNSEIPPYPWPCIGVGRRDKASSDALWKTSEQLLWRRWKTRASNRGVM